MTGDTILHLLADCIYQTSLLSEIQGYLLHRLQAARQFLPEYGTPASSAKDASLDGMHT